MKLGYFLCLALVALVSLGCPKKEDEEKGTIVNIVVKVVDSDTQDAISGARVIYNANEIWLTDASGEIKTTYNLGDLLADSVSFYVSKAGYNSIDYSSIVGNTQRDIYLIPLVKK